MTQQDILAKLGLSESEQKAYITLLAMGQLSEGELAKFSNIRVQEVIGILSQLKEKGLAHEIHGITAKWVASYPFKDMSESIAHLRTDLAALSSDLDAVLKNRVTEYQSYSEQTRKEMEESLDRTKRTIKISTDTMKEDFEKFTDSIVEKSNGILKNEESQLIQTIKTTLDAEKTQLSDIRARNQVALEEATTSVTTAVSTGKEQVKQQTAHVRTSLISSVDDFEAKTRANATTHLDNATTTLEQGSVTLNDVLTSSFQNFNMALEELQTKLETMAKEQSRAMTGVGNTVKTNAMGFAEKRQSDIHTFLGSVRDQNAAIMEQHSTTLRERADQTHKRLIAKANQELNQLRMTANTVIENLQSNATTIVQALESKVTQLLQTFQEAMSAGVAEFNTTLQQQGSTFGEQVESSLQSFETTLTNTTQEFATGMSSLVGEIDTRSKEAVEQLVTEQLQTADGETTQFKEQIEATINQGTEQTEQLSSSFREESQNLFKGSSDEVQEIITSAKGTISQLAEQVRQSHKQAITDHLERLGSIVAEQKEVVNTNTAELETSLEANLTTHANTIDTTTQTLQQTFNNLVTNGHTAIDTVQQELAETIQQATTQLAEQIRMNTSSLQDKAIDTMNESFSTSMQAIDTTETTIGTGIKEQINTLIGKLQDFSEQFANKVQGVSDIVGNTETALGTLWDIVQTYDRKPLFTAVLLGKESIISYMEKMLKEVKSTITLVTPSYQFLPVDAIKAVKSAVRVSILTTVDPMDPSDREFIQDLYQQENVRVRTIQRERIEYWGADRDSEEVVLAPAEPERPDAELVGVATQTKGFIDLLSKVTVGSYLMGMSKEISRREVDM